MHYKGIRLESNEEYACEEAQNLCLSLTSLALRLSARAEEIIEQAHTPAMLMLNMAMSMTELANRLNESEVPKSFDVKLAKVLISAVPKLIDNPN